MSNSHSATGTPELADIDQAIASEDAARAEGRAARRVDSGRIIELPRLLRWIGASVLAVAAFTFMVQSWEHGDDITRYYHFLAFTGALGAAGLFCGVRIRDEKGARTFLGLAAAMVPVHFTVLGALLYSQFAWLSDFPSYPVYARFSAPDGAVALATTALGIAVLLPVCWTAFLTFARPAARSLTVAFLLANVALLIPTRHPDLIGPTALALLCGVVVFDRWALSSMAALRTFEGRCVRSLMAAPFLILIARTIHLYDSSALFSSAVLASTSVLLFSVAPAALRSRAWGIAAQSASVVPTTLAWFHVVNELGRGFQLGNVWVLPLAGLPLAGIFAAQSLRMLDGGAGLRRLAAIVATGSMALQLVFFPGVLSSIACLAAAIVTTAYGCAAERRWVFLTGMAALAFGLLYHLRFTADLYALSPWGSLAVLGAATVFAASLLERHHRALADRLLELKGRVDAWNA
jgi:hypothetical protein